MNASRAHLFFLIALMALVPGAVMAQESPASDDDFPGSKRPGFYLSADLGGLVYDLDDAVSDRFTQNGIDLSDHANGFGLALGYSWHNEFALEIELYGAGVSTGTADIDAALVKFDLIFRVPLLKRQRLAPYLEGHLGSTGLGFEGSGVEDRVVYGGHTGAGAGLEIHLARRWALDFGYRFSLVSFQEESIELRNGGTDEIEIDGTGRVHRWVMATTFSF